MVKKYRAYAIIVRCDKQPTKVDIVRSMYKLQLAIDFDRYKHMLYGHYQQESTDVKVYDLLLKIFDLEEQIVLTNIRIIDKVVRIEFISHKEEVI